MAFGLQKLALILMMLPVSSFFLGFWYVLMGFASFYLVDACCRDGLFKPPVRARNPPSDDGKANPAAEALGPQMVSAFKASSGHIPENKKTMKYISEHTKNEQQPNNNQQRTTNKQKNSKEQPTKKKTREDVHTELPSTASCSLQWPSARSHPSKAPLCCRWHLPCGSAGDIKEHNRL